MNRAELFGSIVAAGPDQDDIVYIERRGDDYAWRLVPAGAGFPEPPDGPGPDVWMYYSGAWPLNEPARLPEFFDDLLAELESMAGGSDRCRWPLDEPWPHGH